MLGWGVRAMFGDRVEAGVALGRRLAQLKELDPIVLGLPRGGLPVAAEVARALDAPLDVILVRKLGVPGQPEFAMGAIGEGGVRHIDWNVVASAGVSGSQVTEAVGRETKELRRRAARLRAGCPPLEISGRAVIIVDDGIATGSTVTAAVMVARDLGADYVIIAIPVAPREAIPQLERIADEVVVLETPHPFHAVGEGYREFGQIDDGEVVAILRRARSGVMARQCSRGIDPASTIKRGVNGGSSPPL